MTKKSKTMKKASGSPQRSASGLKARERKAVATVYVPTTSLKADEILIDASCAVKLKTRTQATKHAVKNGGKLPAKLYKVSISQVAVPKTVQEGR